ncbi:hypothetical protein KUCAC02_023866, partial [Chaenocephalus aceratus]
TQSDGRTLGIGVVRSGRAPLLEEAPVRGVRHMLSGIRGKRAQRIKVSAAATALHQCVQSLHMKMTVYKTSAEAKFRSKATPGRRGAEGGVGADG